MPVFGWIPDDQTSKVPTSPKGVEPALPLTSPAVLLDFRGRAILVNPEAFGRSRYLCAILVIRRLSDVRIYKL